MHKLCKIDFSTLFHAALVHNGQLYGSLDFERKLFEVKIRVSLSSGAFSKPGNWIFADFFCFNYEQSFN
jgi:hypothetical protein